MPTPTRKKLGWFHDSYGAPIIVGIILAAAAAVLGFGESKQGQPAVLPEKPVESNPAPAEAAQQLKIAEAERERVRMQLELEQLKEKNRLLKLKETEAEADRLRARAKADEAETARLRAAKEKEEMERARAERDKPTSPPADEPTRATSTPSPTLVEVEVVAKLENLKVEGSRPFLGLSEVIDITVGNRRISLQLSRSRPRATRTICLPEGLHHWRINASGKTKGFPGNGGFPYSFSVVGGGVGLVLVKKGCSLSYKRGPCEGCCYPVCLQPTKVAAE